MHVPRADHIPLARTGDPTSSHLANASIDGDRTIKGLIIRVGKLLEALAEVGQLSSADFTDSDLLMHIENITGRRHQRNVIARSRGLMERDGLIERIGQFEDPLTHRQYEHFILTGYARRLR